jgi:hypothetical protein
MDHKRWLFYGFVYVVTFPIMALTVNIVLESKGIDLTRLFLAGFYPLGTLWFA